LGCLAVLAMVLHASAQTPDWNTAGNNIISSEWFGADGSSIVPLQIRHDAGDQPIELYSTGDANPEVFLTPTLTGIDYATHYDFTFDVSGNLGVGTGFSMTNPPLTKLHIGFNQATPTLGFREWMKSGLLNTEGLDGMYVGLKSEGDPETNSAIINWSDNRLAYPDPLRFTFTAGPLAPGAMATSEGMELARLLPDPSGDEGYFGIGDFNAAGVAPTERLDVVNGRVRIRQLPDDSEGEDLTKVLVVDDVDNMSDEYGVVKWRDASNLFQCDWVVQPSADVSTAYVGQSSPCPTEENNVGIGREDPFAKLDVLKEVTEGMGIDFGVRSVNAIDEGNKFAFAGFTEEAGLANVGALLSADNAERNLGVAGFAGSGGAGTDVVGGFFQADREDDSGDAIAVWGRVENMSAVGTGWAAYFEGDGFLSNGPWVYSDEELKSNIQDVTGEASLDRILTLNPKSYVFNTADHPGMGMPTGLQYGLLAQDVEEVYPELVKQVHRPAVIGPDGQVQEEAISFKAMKYEGMIADLIGAVQQQQNMIADLQEQVAACCANRGGQRTIEGGDNTGKTIETDLRVIPNPLADRTELRYTVGTEGRVRLEITDAMSRTIQVQDEGSRTTGAYVYEWNTTMLAAGTYYCTLYVNDEPLVKKAVKLNAR
jgi:hypothetical protein